VGGMPASESQEDQHPQGVGRAFVHQSVQVVDVLSGNAAAGERGQNEERAEVHEGVDQNVNQHALDAHGIAGDDAEQDVAGVVDGAVGEQALGVGLGEGGEIADGHGEHRGADEQRLPGCAGRGQGAEQQAQQQGERGGLRADGEIGGDGGGRAFIGVGGPHMEGRGGDFEEQADQDGPRRRGTPAGRRGRGRRRRCRRR